MSPGVVCPGPAPFLGSEGGASGAFRVLEAVLGPRLQRRVPVPARTYEAAPRCRLRARALESGARALQQGSLWPPRPQSPPPRACLFGEESGPICFHSESLKIPFWRNEKRKARFPRPARWVPARARRAGGAPLPRFLLPPPPTARPPPLRPRLPAPGQPACRPPAARPRSSA